MFTSLLHLITATTAPLWDPGWQGGSKENLWWRWSHWGSQICERARLSLCTCACVHLQAQTYIRGGPRKREREREEGNEVSVATDNVSFLSTSKVTGMGNCSYYRCCANKNTNRLQTSKMPADMFRWASLHNECWFSANCLDNELTGFIAMVHSDPSFLLLETKH